MPVKKRKIPSREEIAWAAGVFCGEGSLTKNEQIIEKRYKKK